jgi:RsiW-degrading membrane proteinase PrsW (M82 family)
VSEPPAVRQLGGGPAVVPAPAPAAKPTVRLRCLRGPDAGKALVIAEQPVWVAAPTGDPRQPQPQYALASWCDGVLRVQAAQGSAITVDGAVIQQSALAEGRQFGLGVSYWQVGDAPPAAESNVIDVLTGRLNQLASLQKLEGFSLRQMFSEVFKRRSPEEIEEYFISGTSKTTPRIEDVQTGWPKPWIFMRVLLLVALIYAGFYLAWEQFQNTNLLPGMMMVGSVAVPLATVFLFFELNTPRNVSFHQVLILVALGGVVSLFVALIGFQVSNLSWLGASQAGIVEETGKLVAVVLLVGRPRYKYILNGMLFGAAVGAGFAVFESAGYAFNTLLSREGGMDAMLTNIRVRAFLSPFGHVAWTAIAAGALWRVKGARGLTPAMFFNKSFLGAFLFPVVLHMIWNSPIPSPFYVKHILLGVLGWFIVFGLVQQGLWQIRDLQVEQTKQELHRTKTLLAIRQ